jgi:hypothetical protein
MKGATQEHQADRSDAMVLLDWESEYDSIEQQARLLGLPRPRADVGRNRKAHSPGVGQAREASPVRQFLQLVREQGV